MGRVSGGATRLTWFLHFLSRSISQRTGRFLIASMAITLAVTVVVGMATLSLGIQDKLGETLKAYGANVVVSGSGGSGVDREAVGRIEALPEVAEVLPQIYGRLRVGESSVEVIGTDFGRLRGQGWRLKGDWPSRPGEVLAGAALRDGLGMAPGRNFEAFLEDRREMFTVVGIVDRGGEGDQSLYLSLEDAGRIWGDAGVVSALLVRSRGGAEAAAQAIVAAVPGVTAKSLRQVARAEESLLRKVQLLMGLVTLVVVVASVISVGSTMGATVLERREEIGLMKAVGGTRSGVAAFYLAEASAIGAAGGLLGLPLGIGAAELVSKGAFGSWVSVPLWLLPAGLLVGMAVATLSGHFPVRDAMKPQPSEILRGG